MASFAGDVHGLASLPAFGSESNQTFFLERLQVAAEGSPIHRESLRQRGDRGRLIHIDGGQNGKLRRIQAHRPKRLVVGSGDQARSSPQASAGAGIDELLRTDHGITYEVHIHYHDESWDVNPRRQPVFKSAWGGAAVVRSRTQPEHSRQIRRDDTAQAEGIAHRDRAALCSNAFVRDQFLQQACDDFPGRSKVPRNLLLSHAQ